MGCGSSRGATVVPMPMPSQGEQLPDKNPPPPRVEAANHKESKAVSGNIIRVKEVSNSCDSIPVESQYGSTDSIVSSTKSNGSDCRNSSAKSNDSGIGRGECSSDFIITEKSSPVLQEIASVPDGAKDLGLAVNGKQMKTPAPVGHRKRSRGRLPPVDPRGRPKIQPDSQADKEMTEDDALQAILQKHVQFAEVLIEELPATSSIVKRPVSRGGVAFDIKADGEQSVAPRRHNKPACVLKYAQQQRAAELVTHAELDEKQKAADQRRKAQEQMRLERIWAQQEKDRQVAEALAKFAAMQTELKSDIEKQPRKKTVTLSSKKPSGTQITTICS